MRLMSLSIMDFYCSKHKVTHFLWKNTKSVRIFSKYHIITPFSQLFRQLFPIFICQVAFKRLFTKFIYVPFDTRHIYQKPKKSAISLFICHNLLIYIQFFCLNLQITYKMNNFTTELETLYSQQLVFYSFIISYKVNILNILLKWYHPRPEPIFRAFWKLS